MCHVTTPGPPTLWTAEGAALPTRRYLRKAHRTHGGLLDRSVLRRAALTLGSRGLAVGRETTSQMQGLSADQRAVRCAGHRHTLSAAAESWSCV